LPFTIRHLPLVIRPCPAKSTRSQWCLATLIPVFQSNSY
jgi:hypothetical protein